MNHPEVHRPEQRLTGVRLNAIVSRYPDVSSGHPSPRRSSYQPCSSNHPVPPREALSPAAGIETVVLRTASITPDQAANYLVEAVPGLVKRDDAPAGRAIVTGAGGIALELRGGGDEGDEGDDGSSSSVKLPSEPRDPPKLAAIFVGTDNPAKARNTALRNGAIPQREGPGSGERCAGDAYAGCVANLIGFPLVFVKTRSPKPSLVRVAVSGALDASVVLDALGGDASGLSVDPAGKGQVGVVERAAEDPPPQGRGVILTPAAGGLEDSS